jgi:hypothetical protein
VIDPKTDPLDSAYADAHFKERCRQLITVGGARTVCEIGGGRSPLFSLDEVRALGLDYSVLDISPHELRRAPDGYTKVVGDIGALDASSIADRYDFMFSRMVAEHVRDGAAMHRNVFSLLRPNGAAFHLFPTLFAPAFVLNRLLPEGAGQRLVVALWPNRASEIPKFPVRYSKCFGPTRRMQRFFEGLGYGIEEYRPFYGTTYAHAVPVLGRLEAWFNRTMARRRSTRFTSYAWLVLRKPRRGAGTAHG